MRRLIVKESIPRDQIDLIAWNNHWIWWEEYEQGEDQPYENVWITIDEKTGIHYIEDFIIDVRYFLVEGLDQEEIVKQLCSSLRIYSESDFLRMVETAKNTHEYIHAIYHAGVGSPQQYNSEFFKIFEHALSNSDAEVRRAAILAIGYMGWLEFRPLLEYVKTSDTEPDVRKHARIMLEGFDEQAKN